MVFDPGFATIEPATLPRVTLKTEPQTTAARARVRILIESSFLSVTNGVALLVSLSLALQQKTR
jgi:hypothetical protein